MDHRTLSKRKAEIFGGLYSEQKNTGQHLKRYKKSTAERQIYTHLTPNHTLYNVSIPLECQHIRRFTSDGKYLITFTPCYHGISLYSFMNATYTPATASDEVSTHRYFNHFFKLKYLSMLTMPPGHVLNVDFCLITKDQKYMILNSVGSQNTQSHPAAPVVTDITVPLSDFAFYTVNIETGKLVDQHLFHSDFINIVDHAGVSLYDDQFAVLSVQTQTIHLFRISESGAFDLLRSLCKFLFSGDALTVFMQETEEQQHQETLRPSVAATDNQSNSPGDVLNQHHVPPVSGALKDPPATSKLQNLVDNAAAFPTGEQQKTMIESINGFQMDIGDFSQQNKNTSVRVKHGRDQLREKMDCSPNQDQEPSSHNTFTQVLLSLMCKLFVPQASELGKQYFYIFNWLTSSKMWRMQLIGPNRLLVKLTQMPPEFTQLNEGGDVYTPELERAMFVIFDIAESRIVDLFEDCSNKVGKLMLKSAEALRNATPTVPCESTPGMSEFEQEHFRRKIKSWSRVDKNGSHQFAMQKLSFYLPRQPSAQPQCPYFDPSLFRYPEEIIAFQNWSCTTLDTMDFYSKTTDLFCFRLDARESSDNNAQAPPTLTMTIPNPQHPFIITRRVVPVTNETRNVNFHVRL